MNTLPFMPVELRSQRGEEPRAVEVLRLEAGTVRSFDPAHACLVRALSGGVWVTQAGNPFDVILAPGERFVAARRGKIVVQALEDSVVRMA